ncbi:hypothetical protein [uncultured Dokdonia sp.]|uniref:hypothetical protein n=1 Tax=uncultured Dokdonia sp. TaxID=575653 RepID=UPI00262CA9AB|nr:hypothetical protein [uncultured Dokdonia sp.]
MGRWMEAINKERKVVLETTPYFLLDCSKYLPKRIRKEFPILLDLDIHSDKWIDELQILNLDTVKDLNQELSRVRRILNLEEFIPKIDSKKNIISLDNKRVRTERY